MGFVRKTLLSSSFLFISLLYIFFVPTQVSASEGFIELRSTTGQKSRCLINSHVGQDNRYALLVTCRDLIYPIPGEAVGSYTLWANPIPEGPILKWGTLNFGKAFLKSNTIPFSSAFVTIETNPKAATPAGPIVMQGSVQPVAFLDLPSSPTPTPEGEDLQQQLIEETQNGTLEPTPEAPSTRGRASTVFRRASLIVAVVLMIGAITALVIIIRSRKR